MLILVTYAILWQQILKRMDLTSAFMNKAITIVWGMMWGSIFFGEIISWNMVLGAAIVITGVIVMVKEEHE